MSDFLKSIDSIRKAKSVEPIYSLLGTEYILKQRILDTISSRVDKQHGDRPAWERFYYDEGGAEAALLASQSLSLFSTRNYVVLENCSAFLATSKGKFDTEALEAYLQNPSPDTVLCICIPGDKLDERKKLSKLLKNYPVIDCFTPKDDVALGILSQFADREEIRIDKDALSELWRRAGTVTQSVTELKKLYTYTAGELIGMKEVEDLVSSQPEDNVFHWIDCVIRGKLDLVYQSMSDIQKAGYDGFALLAMMARQIRLMWFAKVLTSKGHTHQQIASRVGAHPYAVKVAEGQSENFSQKRLEEILTTIADGEYAVKSGRRDIMQVLDFVVLTCAVKQGRTRAR